MKRLLRSLLRSRKTAPHPCHPKRCEPALVKETGPPPRATPARSRFASRLPSSERTGCFLPTSATDSQPEHSRIARLPSAQLALRRPPPAAPIAAEAALTSAVDGARPPFGDPTPAGRALDGARLSFGRFIHGASLLVGVKSRASARRRRLSTAAFSTACGADDRPLTLPVAPRSTWKPRLVEEPEPLPPPSRQRRRLSRPRASSIDRVSPAGSLSRVPAFLGTRHRYRGFATDDSASGARSPLRRSRAKRLDPTS